MDAIPVPSVKRDYSIAISCVGSGIGQSVIDSCRLSGLPLRTVGLGMNPFAFGAWDCDEIDVLPGIYSPGYIDRLVEKCVSRKIDLLIPGHDDEALLLSRNGRKLKDAGIKAVVAGRGLMELARDKRRMGFELSRVVDAFLVTCDIKDAAGLVGNGSLNFPLMAKPRSGAGSRGVMIVPNGEALSRVPADYIIQELAVPATGDPGREQYLAELNSGRNSQISEISVQIVTDAEGRTIGRMSSWNKLVNGIPTEIVPCDIPEVWSVIDRLMPEFLELGLRGPLNVQGRLTDKGFRIFEMNPRFTGITGLRALMGFNEVEACVRAWLGIGPQPVRLDFVPGKFGTRQTTSKAVPISRSPEIRQLADRIGSPAARPAPILLLSGANGFLGRHILEALKKAPGKFRVWTLTRSRENLPDIFRLAGAERFDYGDLANGVLPLGAVDILVHAAFARPHRGDAQMANSVEMSANLLSRACRHNVPAIVNISSQSVYERTSGSLPDETTIPAPATAYGHAKHAIEKFLEAMAKQYPGTRACSLRLSALAGHEDTGTGVDVISKLCRKAISGQPVEIVDGSQIVCRLDVRDAADAVLALLDLPRDEWRGVYNIGSAERLRLSQVAELCFDAAESIAGTDSGKIMHAAGDEPDGLVMDSSLFMRQTGWKPRFTLRETIAHIIGAISREETITT